MSRIGKKTIEVPEGVEVELTTHEIKVKGPKGELFLVIPPELEASLKEKEIVIRPKKDAEVESSAGWGLFRKLVFNMVTGVANGFEKKLEIIGVGYRVELKGRKLVMNLGFSHPVEIEAPAGIEFKTEKNLITIVGPDKQLVGQVAAEIRDKKKPEPYKGKGIKYSDEIIRRKAGKKVVGSE